MSNTKKHKEKGKFNQGVLDYDETDKSFQDWCDRQNNEYGKNRKKKKKLKEKIIDKETFQIVYKEMDELTEQQWKDQYLNNIP